LDDAVVSYCKAVPGGLDEIVFRDDPASLCQQKEENVHVPIRQPDGVAAADEPATTRIELKWTEAVRNAGAHRSKRRHFGWNEANRLHNVRKSHANACVQNSHGSKSVKTDSATTESAGTHRNANRPASSLKDQSRR